MLPKQRRLRNRCNWMQSDGCHPVCCIFERCAFKRTIIRISCKCLRHNKSDAVCNFPLWMLNLLECSNTIDNFRQKTTEVVIRKRAKLSRWCCLQRIYIHNVELCRVWHYWSKRFTHTHNDLCHVEMNFAEVCLCIERRRWWWNGTYHHLPI